jgi:hypothetical protein
MSFLFGASSSSSAAVTPQGAVKQAEVGQPYAIRRLPMAVGLAITPQLAVAAEQGSAVVKLDEKGVVKNLEEVTLMKRRLAAVKVRKPIGGKLEAGLGGVYPLDINFALDVQTSSGGVQALLVTGATIAGTSDFTSLASLFDVVRCKSVSIHYEPVAGGSSASSTGTSTLVHQPMMVVGDDDAVAAIAFAVLTQRDHRDPRNLYTNTSKSAKRTFLLKPTFNSTGSTSVLNNMACWQDTNAMSHATGGVMFSMRTDTRNVSAELGLMLFSFHTEWSTRL